MKRMKIDNCEAETNSLAGSAWMRLVSRYLTGSIRIGAYAANLHFLTLIDYYVETYILFPILKKLLYLVYGVLLYEAAVRIVRARYKPKFARTRGGRNDPSDQLTLNETDFAYRVMAEKLIYQSILYYGFSLIIALALFVFLPVENGWQPLALGLLGGFLSVMNFFGVVIVASSGTSFSMRALPMYLMTCGFIVPLLVYIVYTLCWTFSG